MLLLLLMNLPEEFIKSLTMCRPVQERKIARRFKKLYADKQDVFVPDIFWDYTSGKVLTMEWVGEVKLSEQVAIERQVPAYYALMLRSLTVLEGLALDADLDFKVLAAAYPYFTKRLLTDPNPYLRYALIELLFKDGKFRWNSLENLLVQGRKDRHFSAKDALQPMLKLLLGPDGEELRVLAIKEAVQVTEAMVMGPAIDKYHSLPDFLKTLVGNGNSAGPFMMSAAEQQSMMELRGRVLRIWELLQSSRNFDPSILLPIL